MFGPPPRSTLFPYTTLFRSEMDSFHESGNTGLELAYDRQHQDSLTTVAGLFGSMAISTGIGVFVPQVTADRSEEHTSELQSPVHLVCRLLPEKKKITLLTIT